MASKKKKTSAANATAQPSSSAIISLERICHPLSISEKDVIHAFVLGSRLWGTYNENSDYDAYLVVSDKCTMATTTLAQKGFASIHSANIDALVITETTYKGTLPASTSFQPGVQAILTAFNLIDRILESGVFDLVTLFLPREFIIKCGTLPSWTRNLDALEASARKVLARDIGMAQKHAENGKPDKVKKVLTHTVRMIMMATQLVEHGRIERWDCANELFQLLQQSYHLKLWNSFEEDTIPMQQEELTRFEEALARARR